MISDDARKEALKTIDYVLEYIFSDETLSSLVIFKGGTALVKAYGINRFSKDIDLSYIGEGYGNVINGIKEFIESSGFAVTNISANSIEFKVGTLRSSVDVSYLRDVINKNASAIDVVSEEGSKYFVRVMDIDEILAEKVRAIMERREAKDLWDAYKILEKNVMCTKDKINYKCLHSNPGFSFSEEEFVEVVDSWTEHRYLGQLQDYVEEKEIGHLKNVKERLKRFILSIYS